MLKWHEDAVYSAVYSPDGTSVLSPTPPCQFFLCAKDLQKGSEVIAADGQTKLKVSDIRNTKTNKVTELHIGGMILKITSDHRVMVPGLRSTQGGAALCTQHCCARTSNKSSSSPGRKIEAAEASSVLTDATHHSVTV